MIANRSSNNHKAKDFPLGFPWLNTNGPVSIQGLKGYVTVLDFWTYCCINCMHTLPTLARLEKKYHGQPVAFIGVHSAKYFNEQQAKNVKEAIARYEIGHPVVVDQEMQIWRSYNVSAWPTIVIVDPKGNIVYHQAGEGQYDELDDVISILLEQHRAAGTLSKNPLAINPSPASSSSSPLPQQQLKLPKPLLSYPGKLAFSPDGSLLAISDSNHNRVLIVDAHQGNIIHQVGGLSQGLLDGNFEQAHFFRPQGLAWGLANNIYVADTENHAIREINIAEKTVKTLAGNGMQGAWISGARAGKDVSLSSPWDIVYYSGGFLFIAMAGLHQIWAYHISSGQIGPFAGSGYENIVDGSFADSQFAQPSGLSLYGNNFLVVADSETSAIRLLDMRKKTVQTVVGEGLFEFGSVDGPLAQARLQHPLGVHCNGNKIYVADTYNHALRLIDLDVQNVSTLIGSVNIGGGGGEKKAVCQVDDPSSSSCILPCLFEPSDVKQKGDVLYIADTNNHCIRTLDLRRNDTMILGTFEITEKK